MADDPERDLIPTKEGRSVSSIENYERQAISDVRSSVHLSRSDLEDQFYKFKEENLQLKKAAKKQEDELKKLATKMSRLLRAKRKIEAMSSPGHKRDLELEEMVEELQDTVRSLEKANVHLREKILVAKQQVISQIRRPYAHVPPKINSGMSRSGISPYNSTVNLRGKNTQSGYRISPGTTPIPPYAINLLEEARSELANLKMLVSSQKAEMDIYEQENEILKQKLRMKEIEFEDELNVLKSQMTRRQRQHVQENLDLIRLHRELKQKSNKLIGLQSQYNEIEEKMKLLKLNHDHLVKEVDELSIRLKNEQKKNLDLMGELQKREASLTLHSEIQETVKSLQKENDVLRDTNDKLIKSALNLEKEKVSNLLEQDFKNKVVNLETTLTKESDEKRLLQDELAKEKEKVNTQNTELLQLQETCSSMKINLAELEEKLNLLKSQDVNFDELGEALALIKLKKQKAIKLSFLSDTPDEVEDFQSRLSKSESDHTETVKELANVREMLLTQYKLNKDAQEEIKALSVQLEQQEKEFQVKIEEYAHLLDIRAARIQKLEHQLNDIAFGTKTFNLPIHEIEEESFVPEQLSRGENIFEIHIIKVVLSNDGLAELQDNNPSTFMTWSFYEFELQSTPIVKSAKPHFNCTSQYNVQVDDFFLYYLNKTAIRLELHESLGTDYRTVAVGYVKFSEVIDQPHGRLHGTTPLIGTSYRGKVDNFGKVDYWIRLHIPMEEAFKLYKEKIKALKYIGINKDKSTDALRLLKEPQVNNSNINELHVKINRCTNLQSNQKDLQPSAFCVYKFYDLLDQDTAIIPASNNPEFSDHRTFPIYMDTAIVKYLKTQNLIIYVFDDNDPNLSSHIGKATITLLPLSQNKSIKGVFELKKDPTGSCGAVEVSIYWQHDFKYPSSEVSFPEHIDELLDLPSHVVHEVTSSPESSDDDIFAKPDTTTDYSIMPPPVPKPRARSAKTKTTSTPIKKSSSEQDSLSDHSPPISPVKTKDESILPPTPAARTSKVQLESVEDFVSYGKSIMGSPSKATKTQDNSFNGIKKSTPPSSTVKERENPTVGVRQTDEDSFEEISDDDKQMLSQDSDELTESESDSASEKVHNISIRISHLTLKPDAVVMRNPMIKMLFVEYR